MKKITKNEILNFHGASNRERRLVFRALARYFKRYYTDEQRKYAFRQIDEFGIKATSRILGVSRSTLQRWCRKYNIHVVRCPEWVYVWAWRRKIRREFWAMRGYGGS